MNYAVNIGDMMQDEILSKFLIAPVIDINSRIEVERNSLDGMGVLVNCCEERILLIIDIVRTKYYKNKFRFYTSKTLKSWKRV